MAKRFENPAIQRELAYPLAAPLNITHVSPSVAKRVQEWLTLHGYGLVIDGEPGPATRAALIKFASRAGGNVAGVLDVPTWSLLTTPLDRAAVVPEANGRLLRQMYRLLAGQHLAQAAREVGGDNCGPWVRSYCRGQDGKAYRWCAGFVSTLLAQAAQSLGTNTPIGYSLDCDELESDARQSGRLITKPGEVTPGDIFLCMRGNDAYHTGIVTSVASESFGTIEGNTNDEGSSNGYEVCARFRGFANKRFIRIS